MFIGLNSGKPIQIYNGHVSFPLKSFKGADQFLLTKTEGAKSKKKKKKKKKKGATSTKRLKNNNK
jgi:hypothetical protein